MTDSSTEEVDDTVEQMSYKDALDYAIFAINTFTRAGGLRDLEDVDALEIHADEIIATLADIRETVEGLGARHEAPRPHGLRARRHARHHVPGRQGRGLHRHPVR